MRESARLCAGLFRAGLFALTAFLAYVLQQQDSPGQATTDIPLVDAVASACVASVAICACCILALVALRVIEVLVPGTLDGPRHFTRISTLVPVVGAANASDDGFHGALLLSWYFLYTGGLAVFTLSYTLQCTALMPSLALAMSSVFTAAFFYAYDHPMTSSIFTPRSLSRLACIVAAGCCLAAAAGEGTWGPALPRKGVAGLWDEAWDNGWLGTALPLITPPLIATLRPAMRRTRSSGVHTVLFALPFVAAISMCYLGMYAPLVQAAAWRVNATAAAAAGSILANNRTDINISESLSLLEEDLEGLVTDAVRAVAIRRPVVWLIYLALQWGAIVTFTGGVLQPSVMPSCSVAFAAVLLVKRAASTGLLVATQAAAVCSVFAALALVEHCSGGGDLLVVLTSQEGDAAASDRDGLLLKRSQDVFNDCSDDDEEARPGVPSYRSAFCIGDEERPAEEQQEQQQQQQPDAQKGEEGATTTQQADAYYGA